MLNTEQLKGENYRNKKYGIVKEKLFAKLLRGTIVELVD